MPLEYALQRRGQFPDPGPWKIPPSQPVQLLAELGVEDLPRQIFTKTKKKPFVFNIMVVGETGLGKTTFMNTLFNADLEENVLPRNPQETTGVQVEVKKYELSENSVTLLLSIIDTPGFGDQLNRQENLDPILEYIDGQYEAYHQNEKSHGHRGAIPDDRVHVLLYFIAPTGHSLKELDIIALKALASKVNVVPVIAKADTLTMNEKEQFKRQVLADLQAHEIPFYPTGVSDETEYFEELAPLFPFTVVGSNNIIVHDGQETRGRKYRWGVVSVDDEDHSDFVHLRRMLMDNCLYDLIETTHSVHYAHYRASKMRAHGRRPSVLQCDDAYETRIEQTKVSLQEEMFKKEEEMRQNFVSKVREKEQELRQREETLLQKRNQLMQELEEEKNALELEEREIDALLSQSGIKVMSIFGKK